MSVNKCICCNNTFDLGCFGHCGDIETGINAALDGDYEVQWEFNGVVTKKTLTLTIGNPIVLDASWFNEDFKSTVQVFNPNGDVVLLNDGGVDYDCLTFRIKPQNYL